MISAPDGKLLIDSYLKWLKTKYDSKAINEYCEITTPLLDQHSDYLQIYVKATPDGYYLTDDGYVINDLSLSGCDLSNSRRRLMLQTVLNGYGVQLKDDELTVKASTSDFAQKKHNLLQAMLAIGDLFYTTRSRTTSIFTEEVSKYLLENDIRFTESVQLFGRSGFTHNYNFIIPKSKKMPDRALKVVNSLNKDKTQIIIFACSDTLEIRKDLIIHPIINDTGNNVSTDLLAALSEYNLKPILWSRRDEYKEELAS